jgi:hypothetical protein
MRKSGGMNDAPKGNPPGREIIFSRTGTVKGDGPDEIAFPYAKPSRLRRPSRYRPWRVFIARCRVIKQTPVMIRNAAMRSVAVSLSRPRRMATSEATSGWR